MPAAVNALKENNYIDVQEWLLALGRKVHDDDMEDNGEAMGVDLGSAALHYLSTYSGTSTFVVDMRNRSLLFPLTQRQKRAVLNCLRNDLLDGRLTVAGKENRSDPVPVVDGERVSKWDRSKQYKVASADHRDHNYVHQCGGCLRWFQSMIDLRKHSDQECGTWAPVVTGEGTLLDISGLPDGNYAWFDPSKGGSDIRSYTFVQVKTVKRTLKRDRKYRYGKLRSGKEIVAAGTIEVRLERGDTKELIGEQRPGEGYRGTHSEVLIEIMKLPSLWATFYATHKGCCYVCGKSLTDDVSRDDGIGPECFKQWGLNYFEQWNRRQAVEKYQAEHGADDTDEEE